MSFMMNFVAAEELLRLALKAFGIKVNFDYSNNDQQRSIDDRILKIERAKESLTEALSAIDDLRVEAIDTQATLNALTKNINVKTEDKIKLEQDLDLIRSLTNQQKMLLRKTLGVPTNSAIAIRLLGSFVAGVIASIAAHYLIRFLS